MIQFGKKCSAKMNKYTDKELLDWLENGHDIISNLQEIEWVLEHRKDKVNTVRDALAHCIEVEESWNDMTEKVNLNG